MTVRPNTLTIAYDTILNSAKKFAPFWGEPMQTEGGDVQFSKLPDLLEGLQVKPRLKRWVLGGVCSMTLHICRKIETEEKCFLSFRGNRGGHFFTKDKSCYGEQLQATLNTDRTLMELLCGLDLEELTLQIESGHIILTMTPFGGGLVYLALPPLRYPVAFPADQIETMVNSMERLNAKICV